MKNKKTASVILTSTPLKHCEFMEMFDPKIVKAMEPKPLMPLLLNIKRTKKGSFIEKLKKNPALLKLYSALTYFEQGKGTSARFYNPIMEGMGVLAYLAILLNLRFTTGQLILYTIDAILFFTLAGYIYNHSGLLKSDKMVQTHRDPIQSKIYEAANIIIRDENEKKKR